MKLFKNADKKLAQIGFVKREENEYGATYHRAHKGYVQTLDLCHKANGKHLIMSYDAALGDAKGIGHTMVGLTMYEANLCVAKMKEMGWRIVK